ncbi:glyoxalase/bleomycin resistance/extradiol dioxygenase family protein [Levilactobacillus zymae]|uniref:VOC family protein n=2 Tax=Levilactobacillus zymae TaxID=267363 RepID=A0ABQ0WUQ4_9LACO|nr:glyoxalase/bleomycin resistance/extradiol dioxygenase family protein [Levilactobacillus zymae]QFR60039.1 VOC family protein [Levilactobacillus zymae]QFR62394.1 VOC family protein [Levilactobacillus zymae]GEO71525.1 VOC family protein [Levilactobacillus zymae]
MQAKLIPYLEFENAKEALAYYQDVFGATDVYRVSPTVDEAEQYGLEPEMDLDQLTMRGGFRLLGLDVQCADALMGQPTSSTLISLMLVVDEDDSDSVKELLALYQRLIKSDVKVINPFADQTQGGKMGQIVDAYGITWILREAPSMSMNPNVED